MIKNHAATLLLYLLFGCVFIFSFCSNSIAQSKVDLEVKVTAPDTAQGGESFSYTVTVTNKGNAKATDVVQINEPSDVTRLLTLVSGLSSKGNCEKYEYQFRLRLSCEIGDLEPDESVTITVQSTIAEFGGEQETETQRASRETITKALGSFGSNGGTNQNPAGSPLGNIHVSAAETEENQENNRTEIFANLLPSKNIPPRVKILSPKNEAVIARPAKKLTKVEFIIKAFDPDGKIEKVTVNTQQFYISVEYPENRIVIEGKSYSIKEVEDNKEEFRKYFGGDAKKIGKDTYSFTIENPRYGFNNIFVEAHDNGNRVGYASVRLTIKGDNSIEFTKPQKDSVIQPNTNVTIETISKLNEGKVEKLELIGNALCCGNPPLMQQIFRNGNTYIHHYLWKNIRKGYYSFQVILTEDSGAFTYSNYGNNILDTVSLFCYLCNRG